MSAPPGSLAVRAPLQGTVVSLEVAEGGAVHAGQPLAVLEAMKLEHLIEAPEAGIVRGFAAAVGDLVNEGQALVWLERAEVGGTRAADEGAVDPARIRPDLAEAQERHAVGLDARRLPRRTGRGAAGTVRPVRTTDPSCGGPDTPGCQRARCSRTTSPRIATGPLGKGRC